MNANFKMNLGLYQNRFMAALVEQKAKPKEEKPIHRFRFLMSELQSHALKGEIKQWNQRLSIFSTMGRSIGKDPESDMTTHVQLKKLELDLLMNAREKAIKKAEETIPEDQKQKLKDLIQWLEGELFQKTELLSNQNA